MMGLVSHGCELVFTVGGRGAIKLGVEGALIGEVNWLEEEFKVTKILDRNKTIKLLPQ